MASATRPKGVQSGARVLDVLECFSTDHLEWGVSEIAEFLGLVKSAVHRFLKTLEEAGFVDRTPRHRYRLGVRALEIGNVYRFQASILQAADQPMRQLAERTGLAVHLAQFKLPDVLELLRAVGRSETCRKQPPVLRKPAHASAVGKVLLAAAGDSMVDRFIGLRRTLPRYTEFTIIRPEEFRAHLERVRREGFAVDHQESERSRYCLSVPIYGAHAQVVAALSISSSSIVLTGPERDHYLHQLRQTANSIQSELIQSTGNLYNATNPVPHSRRRAKRTRRKAGQPRGPIYNRAAQSRS